MSDVKVPKEDMIKFLHDFANRLTSMNRWIDELAEKLEDTATAHEMEMLETKYREMFDLFKNFKVAVDKVIDD